MTIQDVAKAIEAGIAEDARRDGNPSFQETMLDCPSFKDLIADDWELINVNSPIESPEARK